MNFKQKLIVSLRRLRGDFYGNTDIEKLKKKRIKGWRKFKNASWMYYRL